MDKPKETMVILKGDSRSQTLLNGGKPTEQVIPFEFGKANEIGRAGKNADPEPAARKDQGTDKKYENT